MAPQIRVTSLHRTRPPAGPAARSLAKSRRGSYPAFIIRRAEAVEREAPMNQADIDLMNSLNWYHKIELIDGQ
jgi:hypothetical protein